MLLNKAPGLKLYTSYYRGDLMQVSLNLPYNTIGEI